MMSALRRMKNTKALLCQIPLLSGNKFSPGQFLCGHQQRPTSQEQSTKSLMSVLSRTDTSIRILVPGWSFDDLDRHGNLRLWKALNVIDKVREYAFDEVYIDYRQLENTHMTYVKCLSIVAQKEFMEKQGSGHFAYSYPFIINTRLTHIGHTSYCLNHTVETSDGNQILESNIAMVFVENMSNKVSAGPKWWMDKYKPLLGNNTEPYILREKPLALAVSNTFRMIVMPLDIDYYGHVNNTTYQQFCTNAGMALAHKGLLGNLAAHVFDTMLHKIEAVYISDCKLGDQLDIHVEVDHLDKNCTFNITKNKNMPVYQQTVYY